MALLLASLRRSSTGGVGASALTPLQETRMANRRLLDYDPITKTTQWYHYDDATGDIGLETEQDVTAIVEHNKSIFN